MITYHEGMSVLITRQTGPMDAAAMESGPAVSRLCVATAGAGKPGPLTLIQRCGGFYRLYLKTDPAGNEFAVASPGIDEVSLISELISAIRAQVSVVPVPRTPVIAGFHVGVTRLTGGSFGGKGAERVLALIRHPSVLAASASALLVVTMTAGLFEDLRAEGLPHSGWEPVPSADAWLTVFTRDHRQAHPRAR